tara:strand:+ start:98 stop:553 length:456 start_codon:yes stop_codon:yes gene_type:complete
MNKISKIIIIIFLLLNNCSYEPILINKNLKFGLNIKSLEGNKQVNSILKNKFRNYIEGDKILDLSLETSKERKVISKNSKGDPAIFEITISIKIIIEDNENIIIKEKITKKSTYDNISDKFELDKFEDIIIKNLTENISNNILLSISNIDN